MQLLMSLFILSPSIWWNSGNSSMLEQFLHLKFCLHRIVFWVSFENLFRFAFPCVGLMTLSITSVKIFDQMALFQLGYNVNFEFFFPNKTKTTWYLKNGVYTFYILRIYCGYTPDIRIYNHLYFFIPDDVFFKEPLDDFFFDNLQH